MQYEITAIYAAILGLLTAGLGFAAVIMRARSGISWGHGDSFPLQRAIRAHGNLTEYAPIFLIILLILENAGASYTWLHGLGAAFVTGRLVSALYFWVAQKFALRVIALWGAVLPIVAGAILLLLQA
ncbi:MAG: MAPEG family protein [Rhodobiaceae bacterium]|nr:MAPEG family protein [Rhodobiaceae bacterium]